MISRLKESTKIFELPFTLGFPFYSCVSSTGYLPCFSLAGVRGVLHLVQAFIPLNVCISHVPVCKRELFR